MPISKCTQHVTLLQAATFLLCDTASTAMTLVGMNHGFNVNKPPWHCA